MARHTDNVIIRIRPGEKERLRRLSSEVEMSMSEYIRETIKRRPLTRAIA